MLLHKYWVDFSVLTPNEKSEWYNKLDTCSYDGFLWNPDFQSGTFLVSENYDINFLKIPEKCHLKRVYW